MWRRRRGGQEWTWRPGQGHRHLHSTWTSAESGGRGRRRHHVIARHLCLSRDQYRLVQLCRYRSYELESTAPEHRRGCSECLGSSSAVGIAERERERASDKKLRVLRTLLAYGWTLSPSASLCCRFHPARPPSPPPFLPFVHSLRPSSFLSLIGPELSFPKTLLTSSRAATDHGDDGRRRHHDHHLVEA